MQEGIHQTPLTTPTFICRERDKLRISPSNPYVAPLMRVNLELRLIIPPEITAPTLRSDLILWSNSCQPAYIIELMIPWEDAIEEYE